MVVEGHNAIKDIPNFSSGDDDGRRAVADSKTSGSLWQRSIMSRDARPSFLHDDFLPLQILCHVQFVYFGYIFLLLKMYVTYIFLLWWSFFPLEIVCNIQFVYFEYISILLKMYTRCMSGIFFFLIVGNVCQFSLLLEIYFRSCILSAFLYCWKRIPDACRVLFSNCWKCISFLYY